METKAGTLRRFLSRHVETRVEILVCNPRRKADAGYRLNDLVLYGHRVSFKPMPPLPTQENCKLRVHIGSLAL